jgi:hypothetical protein
MHVGHVHVEDHQINRGQAQTLDGLQSATGFLEADVGQPT